MNNCVIGKGVIDGDNRSQTLTKLVTEAIENSSIELKNRANLILISHINSNTSDFLTFYNNELKQRGIDLVVESIKDINDKVNKRRSKEFNNLTRNILVSYIKHLIVDSNNYNSVGLLSNDGFTSNSARELGAEYVATKLLIKIHNNERKVKNLRVSKEELIKEVLLEIEKERNGVIKSFFDRMDAILKQEDESNKTEGTKRNEHASYRQDKAKHDELNIAAINAIKEYKSFTGEESEKLRLKSTAEKAVIAVQNFKNYMLVKHGNTVERNFVAIRSNLKNNYFIDRIWSQSKISDYRDTYENGFNNDFTSEDEIVVYEGEQIDESTKRWSEEGKANFTNDISKDVKYQLSIIYKMSSKFEGALTEEDYARNYDKDNLCGVPTTYDYKYVVAQLVSRCNATSYADFVEKVHKLATTNPNNYGFISLYGLMLQRPDIGIRIFTQIQKPVIDKTTIDSSNELKDSNNISNEEANDKSSQYYSMIDGIKITYKSAVEYIDRHNRLLSECSNELREQKVSAREKALGVVKESVLNVGKINDNIAEILKFYFPHLSDRTIYAALRAIPENELKSKYKTIISYLQNVVNVVNNQLNVENNAYNEFKEELKEYYKKEKDGVNDAQKPVFNRTFDVTNNATLSKALINLAEFIYPYDKNNVVLNSKNAEGSLASDLQNNTYISRIFTIIKNNDIEGLKNLKIEIDSCPQYKYSPLFYGIRDNNGEILVHGLFNNDNIDGIDEIGVQMINCTLFDGIKDNLSDSGITYKKLTKGDYFITKYIKYFYPSISKADDTTNKDDVCEVFFNTPSDAPKNYTIRLPKFGFRSKGKDLVYIDENKLKELVANRLTSYFTNIFKENYEEDAKNIYSKFKNSKALKYITDEELVRLLTNNGKVGVRINETLNPDYNKDSVFRIVHKNENGYTIIYARDGNFEANKDKRNRQFVLNNATIVDIVSFDKEGNIVPNKAIGKLKAMIKEYDSTDRKVKEEAIANGDITFTVNQDAVMFTAFKQNVKGEINALVNALNAVFHRGKDGLYRIKTKKGDIINLLDRYHYNDTLVKNGKLTGNIFKLGKLFDTSDYSASKELEALISLYGEEGIIKEDEKGLYIDPTNLVEENNSSIVSLKDGKFVLNEKYDFNNLNDIISNWLSSFSKDIVRDYKQYEHIIDETLKLGKDTSSRVIEMILGDVLNNYSTTELFSGEPKFYRNSRDYLKRAKEIQAGGENYAFYDLNEKRNSEIVDLESINLSTEFIDTKGNPISIKPKNGFRAITIKNTVGAISNNDKIYKEIYDHNVKKLKESGLYNETEINAIAKTRATQIAERFGYGKDGRNTKKNDAQSYITFEEFIRRKMADGTIDEYKDIINKIKEIRQEKDPVKRQQLIDNFDLSQINSRIQVQKNFYFDMAVDKNTGVRYPRQVKNAEFVLIPEFLEGTELLGLYNIMVEYGIDQVNTEETTKATKRNVITYWDNNGKVNPKFINELTSNPDIIDTYYYQYLYKQQDVVQHMVDEKNKAGIQILRKMIDNMTDGTKEYVQNYIENYVANIQESFNELLYSCGWKLDNNGNVVNSNGSQISFQEFFKKGKAQAAKLGLDSNFAEYFEIDPISNLPKMPVWMNNVSGKIESISQAIFNSIITRQQLPGWHAAQVTGIGIGKKVKDANGVYHELKYHPEVVDENGNVVNEAYIEIMVPRWSKLLEGKSIEDIQNGKCDIQLIYRMPTEGKQSVAVAKVVGILPDIYGSTVLVPDAWVTQTGSDFDVDTVYAIVYNMLINKEGNVEKIQFDNDLSENAVRKRYINYVARLAKLKLEKGFYDSADQLQNLNKLNNEIEEIKQRIENIKEANKTIFDSYNELTNQIFSLNGNKHVKKLIKETQENAAKNHTNEEGKRNTLAYYQELYNIYDNFILDTTEDLSDDEITQINLLVESTKEILDKLKNRQNTYDALHENIEEFKESKEKLIEDNFSRIEQIAKEYGVASFEEFSSWSIIRQNSRKARENVILDNFVAIMSHPDSREENYYSSNFDDITAANELVKRIKGLDKKSENVHNPFTQVQYLEDAMSGAAIKAFSVTRDNFASICNKTKATLAVPIKVRYHKNVNDESSNYDRKTIEEAYDIVENESTNDVIVVNHNRLANSKNNRNVVGRLCTVYGSQTTAHSLDNIKEGSIYNENLYTFGTFKTLVDLGIDYNTSILWLALPGIDRIVEAYYNTNSVYLNDNGNPIQEAIKQLAIENYLVDEYATYSQALEALKENYKGIAYNMGYDINKPESINTLDTDLIRRRFNGSFNKDAQVAFDLITILQFSNIHAITANIEKLTRCTNPDKFGAKQTIRATFETINNIDNYREKSENTESNNKIGGTVLVDGKYLMDALYPLDDNGNIDIENSQYPYLAAILKHSTIPSIAINSKLFEADYLLMLNELNNSNNQTSLIGRKLTDVEYKQLREYLVHFIYGMDSLLSSPVSINVEEVKGKKTIKGNIVLKAKENTYYWEEEYARVKGYEMSTDRVIINNFDNPTQEEIDNFAKLTPVRKILMLKRFLGDNAGIFNKLGINLYSGRNTKDRIKSGNYTQVLSINLQNENIEELYKEFNNAISSKNPFIKLAAIDLIKYAFLVEGFRFTRNGISNIITNHSINDNRDGFAINGINNSQDLTLIQSFYNAMNNILNEVNNGNFDTINEIMSRFIRSNSEIIKEDRKLLSFKDGNKRKGVVPKKCILENNCYYFTENDEYGKKVINYIKDRYNLNKSTATEESESVSLPDYIKLTFLREIPVDENKTTYANVTTLFKMYQTANGILLIGIPTLDKGETNKGSLNNNNNVHPVTNKRFINPDYADIIAEHIITEELEGRVFDENGVYIKPKLEKIGVKNFEFKKAKLNANTTYDKEDLLIRYMTGTEPQQGGVNHLLDVINEFIESPVEGVKNKLFFYTVNQSIANLITLDDVKHKNNIFRLPNSEIYIKVKKSPNAFMIARSAKNLKINPDTVHIKMRDAVKTYRKFPNTKGTLYEIKILSREEVDNYRNEESKLHSATRTIGFSEGSTARRMAASPISSNLGINQIAVNLGSAIKDVITRPANKDDIFLSKLRNFIQHNGIRINEERDLVRYRKQLYDLLREYYFVKGKEFLNRFDDYFGDETNVRIDDENIHNFIDATDEDFNEFIAFLLDARNFGREFDNFIKFSGDETLNKSIEDINKIIKDVTGNEKLVKAIKNVFNEYLATRFSTNPLVQNRLIDITTSFEDVTKLDKTFADVAELSNKEVQVVVKYVEAILDTNTQLDAPAKQKEFAKMYDSFIEKGADIHRIIDPSTGKVIQDFTEEFIKDKEKYAERVHRAYDNMSIARDEYKNGNISVDEYEKAIINFYRTKLNRNLWLRRNTHQAVVDEYYDKVNDNELSVLFNNSEYREDIAKHFAKYIRLTEELKELTADKYEFSDEEIASIKSLKFAIKELISPAALDNILGVLTEEDKKARFISDTLNEYLQTKGKINKEYFEYIVSEEWKATKDMYFNYIKKYDKEHSDYTIEDKLKDSRYKEAYNWLTINAKKELNSDVATLLYNAIELVSENSHTSRYINDLFKKDNAFDEHGNKDPRKLSKHSIELIKEAIERKNDMVHNNVEDRLIKEVPPKSRALIMNRKFRDLLEPFSNPTNLKKQEIVKKINKILIKAVEPNTGNISSELLWNNTTHDERVELAKLYKQLNELKGSGTKEDLIRLKKSVLFKTNTDAFLRNKNYMTLNLTGEDKVLWNNIFTLYDKESGSRKPNRFMFGYLELKPRYEAQFVDEEKTDAINFLTRNTRKVPNSYYYLARNEAIANGTYEEWFDANHYYNKFTDKIEPLSIWTETEIIPGNNISEDESYEYYSQDEENGFRDLTEEEIKYDYAPTFENKYRQIREEYRNTPNGEEYNKYDYNYRTDTGDYNNTSAYNGLSDEARIATENLRKLLIRYAKEYAFTNQAKSFVNKGFLPRQFVPVHNTAYYARQVAGFVGIEGGLQPIVEHEIDYIKDELPQQSMYRLIEAKGYKKELSLPKKPINGTREEYDAYYEELDKVKKENATIIENNLKLEEAYRSNNWKEVFNQLILQGEDYKAKQKSKNIVYLLLEDLKSKNPVDSSKALKRNKLTDKFIKNSANTTNIGSYVQEEQDNLYHVVTTWAKRVIYSEYKEPHKLNHAAKVLQNIVSSKYMMFNIPGGIANVSTGFTNIYGEMFAGTYFDTKHVVVAHGRWDLGMADYIRSFLFNADPKQKSAAIIKLFTVVNYDDMLGRISGDSLSEISQKVRDFAFSFQSSGEHHMQNIALLAMMDSHRVYQYTNRNGKTDWKVGTFNNYIWDLEQQAMRILLTELEEETGDDSLLQNYENFINIVSKDIEELDKYDSFKKDFNREFIKTIYEGDRIDLSKRYREKVKELTKNAKKDFETKYTTFYDEFDFTNGALRLKADSVFRDKTKPIDDNDFDIGFADRYKSTVFGAFRNKVKKVNNKIHGVYDKLGAASIEHKWWGSLVMQYHKHIYPGLMKRYRGLFNRGYYNEMRESIEMGSYTSLINFLTTEFDGVMKRTKEDTELNNSIGMIAFAQHTFKAFINTFKNAQINWNTIPQWERANMRRVLGDLLGSILAFGVAMLMYLGSDDDELEDNNFYATLLYLTDRIYSEARMYTPWGLVPEFKTLHSSPIAATNSVNDALKLGNLLWQNIIDEDFNPYYTTGRYRGENKYAVTIGQNIPIYRIINRLQNMNKNNKYYRIGQKSSTKRAKTVADWIDGE